MDNPIQPRVGCGRLLRRDSGYSGAQQIYRTVERITRSAAALIGRRASLARAKRWCPRGITRQAFSLQAAILKGSNADALLPPSLTAGSVHRSRFRARGSASTSAHNASPVGSCGCAHERRPTASRACSIAAIRLAMSASEESSRVKFGGIPLRTH